MLIRLACSCIVLCLGFLPGIGAAATLTNLPVADTYFETYGSENKNFGGEPVLRVDQWGGRQAFLRFPMEELPKERYLQKATLRLFIAEVGFNEAGEFSDLPTCVGVYDVVTPWTETGLTFKTADGKTAWHQGPGIGGGKYHDVGPLPKPDIGVNLREREIPIPGAQATKGKWLEIDVSAYVRNQARLGANEVNFLIRSSTLGRSYTFRSREATQINERPQLVLTVSETEPDVSFKTLLRTDWQPGQKVVLRTSRPVPGFEPQAMLAAKPATSKQASQIQVEMGDGSDGKKQFSGLSFQPDAPGRYEVGIRRGNQGESSNNPAETTSIYALTVPSHPRLYVTAESLPRLRKNAREDTGLLGAFNQWVTAGSTGAAAGKFHDMGPHEGCENTSLLWLITQDRQHLTNALRYAERILRKPMREHFQDVHDATFTGAAWVHAMALHYDWCYDQLSPEQRGTIAAWLKEAARWAYVRSGAPIAHNDGGARQCLLGSAALTLLGDDPEAEELYLRSQENFREALLPWLNDGGRGGRSGDGGEYEGLHAFYIVKYAWLAYTATGEDVFQESPFFFNRINHILFGWYPRRLVEARGAYSMRQYYSPSGDHIRMGYVGDTQPYQSAAVLCARYRNTPEAQGLRWLGGDWPTRWMQYTLRWAVLADWENLPAAEPKALAWYDAGCNTVFMRSDWTDDATWILFENSPLVSAHGSLDSGTFEIFKGDLLAARTGNLDHANVGARHTMNYMHRTIAANALMINDPKEKWKGFLGGADGIHDGGGQRSNWPLTTSPEADTYLNYRHVFQRGQITRFSDRPEFTYTAADLTPAYTSAHFHNGNLNQPKVEGVTRELLYLRGLDTLLVYDRVRSVKPEFKKTWLVHSLGELEVANGQETRIDEGESHYTGASHAVIRHGWPLPVPSFGRCLSVTLLPRNAEWRKIGGREELPAGKTESWPGDQWHGRHAHRHIKDFWVNGTNYPPGNPPEIRWFGEPTSQWHVAGTPDESGGRGKWRLEVSPSQPGLEDTFLHVLCPRLGKEGAFPEVERFDGNELFAGAAIREGEKAGVVFLPLADEPQTQFTMQKSGQRTQMLVILGMAPGDYEVVHSDGKANVKVDQQGVIFLPGVKGNISASRVVK